MDQAPSLTRTVNKQNLKDLQLIVESAAVRIPPLWTLQNFVAVNPFLGLGELNFLKAANWIEATSHSDIFMPPAYYLEQFQINQVSEIDFRVVRNKIANQELDKPKEMDFLGDLTALKEYLSQNLNPRDQKDSSDTRSMILSFADFIDQSHNTNWNYLIKDEISKWSSVYFDEGQSLWPMPWRGQGLWNAWRKVSEIDKNPRYLKLKSFEELIHSMPDKPLEVILWALEKLEIPESHQSKFLERQFMSVSGWASYIQYLVREKQQIGEKDDTLIDFLAIRLIFDTALFLQFSEEKALLKKWNSHLHSFDLLNNIEENNLKNKQSKQSLALYLAQSILEKKYQDSLIDKLKKQNTPALNIPSEKILQAVFCIDVRSEVYRRSLESESKEIETLGFAGFFGLAIQYFPFYKESGTALCPVLLQPGIRVKEGLKEEKKSLEIKLLGSYRFKEILQEAWNSFKTSAISCFSFVESVGIGFLLPLFSKSFPNSLSKTNLNRKKSKDSKKSKAFSNQDSELELKIQANLPERIEMAAGALKNMGLTDHFAHLVLFCGHGSQSANNPYASSLDCGACGGHSGEINAKILAQILNQTEVRQGLKKSGIEIPEDTFFIAGLHNTTTDEVKIFEPGTHSLTLELFEKKIKEWLNGASHKSRIKRAEILGSTEITQTGPDKKFHDKVFLNSYDWSQTRPEWGLAGNASFIAAPRKRTQNIDLSGKSFLHNYHADRDGDDSILELIMVAPMIVASWINLQYYGSTVNNILYGSGNKVLHNVVGKLGIWQGNGGDLQSGLPIQSLHDGKKWIHDPMRLSVFIEAPKTAIDIVINKHPDVKNLILNQWIYLFSIEPETNHIFKKTQEFHWEEV